ncbi:MAG: MurR/RpiR family transcriptional regulator [Clostridiales bacterium]|nr:MurR/RpiR family transcriptional regulator [Clostridiales bacterium]
MARTRYTPLKNLTLEASESNNLLVRLKFMLPALPRAEKAVAEYMAANVSQMSDMTLFMLSEETSVSEATILRLCKRLGYSSYIQLRQAFALAANEDEPDSPELISSSDEMPEISNKLIQSVNRSLENTKAFINSDYDRVLNAILKAQGIYFFVSGDATITCQYATAKFNRVGIPSFVCNDIFYQYETAMRLTEKDVAFAVSNSGRSTNVVNSMKTAKEQNAFTCCITQGGRSPLTKYCDVSLYASAVDMTLGRDSVNKRIVELVILESLYLGVINMGTNDYKQMLQNTMLSSEINKL